MKVSKKSSAEVEAEAAKIPERVKGLWGDLCAEVLKSGKAVEVTDITSGQLAALRRRAAKDNIQVKGADKGTRALVLPPKKKA